MERKTPLYDRHLQAGGKIVPFAGYLLPVQYPAGVIAEHLAVREKAGLFDVSHMGEVLYTGPDALANLNHLLTNDFTGMYDGQVRYSPMCNESGGVVDDLIVYKYHDQKYMVVVNAANREKDVAWMRSHLFGDVTFADLSDDLAQVALQGPQSQAILSKLTDAAQIPQKYYSFTAEAFVAGVPCILSQTGYTGEHGYELYTAPEYAGALWDALLDAGKEYGLIPCGLGARDTLRLEAAMPLYGHEMNDSITPLETGLAFAVKLQKEDFIGKAGIELKNPPPRKRVGLKITGRGIVREQEPVFCDGRQIGVTTSGTHCPYLGGAFAMALVESAFAEVGCAVETESRGRKVSAEVMPLPFYKK